MEGKTHILRTRRNSERKAPYMTLQDLIDRVTIEGGVIVKRFSEDGEIENVLLETANFEFDKRKLSEDDLTSEIECMYSTIIDFPYTVIEIE